LFTAKQDKKSKKLFLLFDFHQKIMNEAPPAKESQFFIAGIFKRECYEP